MKRIIRTSALQNGFFNKDRFLISLFVVLGIGLMIGSIAAGTSSADDSSVLNRIWSAYIYNRSEQSVAACFFATFSSCFFMLLAAYVLGVCAVGIPFLYLIPAIDGIGKGIIIGFVYAKYGFIGLIKSLFLIVPQNVIFCFVIILALIQSVKMSRQMFCSVSGLQSNEPFISFKKYNQKFLFLIIGASLCSIIDALLSRFSEFITV
ncbi:MAG: stage II sporulation protein M [Oscillospiraceae bacterium]|nr:stage II sporulation protein M [Oscillospiraceae bacterium]